MKLLILTNEPCDLSDVLESCGAETERKTFAEALHADLKVYDAYAVLADGRCLDARLRERLEAENDRGKRVFAEALPSYRDIYSADPVNTVRSRLIVLAPKGEPAGEDSLGGLTTGDLLDDESNLCALPYCMPADAEHLLVYQEYIIAHRHTDQTREQVLSQGKPGMWRCGDNLIMTSFRMRHFNKARFAPREHWKKLIFWLARWLTGSEPAFYPEPVISFDKEARLSDPADFDAARKQSAERGLRWLEGFLVDGGRGGIEEGLGHNIAPDGKQIRFTQIRTDCSGEAGGAFRMAARLTGDKRREEIGKNLEDFVFGPMVVRGGLFDGMMRWTESAWGVCYQDDVARAILPSLYDCVLFGQRERLPELCRVLDFLVRTTARDGIRVSRTDRLALDEAGIRSLREAEHGTPSAHYNSYYHAALLLAYRCCPEKREYLDTARRGLEYLMSLYPDNRRETSETEEMCRLILPLAILYETTGEAFHRDLLYRVTNDLLRLKDSSGGFREWDTGYTAATARTSRGECSILTENGDPVAELLYSVNWLPMAFAWAYRATGDEQFRELWEDVVRFFIRTQAHSADPTTDGSWCRAFDLEAWEAYGAPHDAGWGPYACETGWTNADIVMGMLLPDLFRAARS